MVPGEGVRAELSSPLLFSSDFLSVELCVSLYPAPPGLPLHANLTGSPKVVIANWSTALKILASCAGDDFSVLFWCQAEKARNFRIFLCAERFITGHRITNNWDWNQHSCAFRILLSPICVLYIFACVFSKKSWSNRGNCTGAAHLLSKSWFLNSETGIEPINRNTNQSTSELQISGAVHRFQSQLHW